MSLQRSAIHHRDKQGRDIYECSEIADRLAELQDIIAESSARANAGARGQKEKEFKMLKTFNYDQGKKF